MSVDTINQPVGPAVNRTSIVKRYVRAMVCFLLFTAVAYPIVVLCLGFHLNEGWKFIGDYSRTVVLFFLFPLQCILLAMFTMLWSLRRHDRRLKRGLCTNCAFNLADGSSEVCPKCGRAVAARQSDEPNDPSFNAVAILSLMLFLVMIQLQVQGLFITGKLTWIKYQEGPGGVFSSECSLYVDQEGFAVCGNFMSPWKDKESQFREIMKPYTNGQWFLDCWSNEARDADVTTYSYLGMNRTLQADFGGLSHHGYWTTLPYWALIVAFGILPSLATRRLWIASRYRRRIGLCPQCLYNLAANVSGVCPECGMPVSPSPSE
jgi:hypothetical protein